MVIEGFLPFTLPASWHQLLEGELSAPYMAELASFLLQERSSSKHIYPPESLVFNALAQTPFEKVKVVLVGQDPYHGPSQAHGLCFSVPPGVAIPPSLQNVYKELKGDLGVEPPKHGSLVHWAHEGVLLLNATLTVCEGEPLSHHGRGWERFTDAILQKVALLRPHVVFLLWGKNAQEKCMKIKELQEPRHLVLKAAHPSPFSAHQGFLGCRHFSQTNRFLEQCGEAPIDWKLS